MPLGIGARNCVDDIAFAGMSMKGFNSDEVHPTFLFQYLGGR